MASDKRPRPAPPPRTRLATVTTAQRYKNRMPCPNQASNGILFRRPEGLKTARRSPPMLRHNSKTILIKNIMARDGSLCHQKKGRYGARSSLVVDTRDNASSIVVATLRGSLVVVVVVFF